MDTVILTCICLLIVLALVCMLWMASFSKRLSGYDRIWKELEQLEARINTRINEFENRNNNLQATSAHTLRTEVRDTLATLGRNLNDQLANFSVKFDALSRNNDDRNNTLCKTLSENLDVIRKTVDEKLSHSLEQTLGSSFNVVSQRLEAVQRGLGEMQQLANGVGDLKRVLGNVKERGTWGEYQLGMILEDILAPQQYEKNVSVAGGGERVEYAVKLPGRSPENECVWLPIDSKFPRESYERLVEASRAADSLGVETAAAELKKAVTKMAKDIQEKYICPPVSTDFAILFLPTEGLYSEVLKQPGLQSLLQQNHRVIIAGPATLSALLNSLRVGFQTLAIEKRASEVWNLLSIVKSEFAKFSDTIEKMKRQVGVINNTLEDSSRRTRIMEKKLSSVEVFPDNVIENDAAENSTCNL